MSIVGHARKIVLAGGLAAILLSFGLDAQFATDDDPPPVTVPAPPSLALLAIAGVSAVAVALIRRKK